MRFPLFYVIFIKAKIRKHLAQKARTDFFFAIFENCFIPPVIQGAMTAFAAFRLKADGDIILLSKFFQFLEKFVAVYVCFIGLFCPNVKARMSELERC
jgi:hypothetical protein